MRHIIHLLGPHISARLSRDQLVIEDRSKETQRTVPVEDIGLLICAANDTVFTASALRRLAQWNVPVLVCNESYEPAAMCLPYFRPTDTALLRSQITWDLEWQDAIFRRLITAKVRNQAANLEGKASDVVRAIAARCAAGRFRAADQPGSGKRIATVTGSRRHLLYSDTPAACESRAARIYWRRFLPPLIAKLGTTEKTRIHGTRMGVNGMLDYGYAILRSAVLRALASRGFIAALGLHHTARAGTFALADDVMEPFRPFIDRALRNYLESAEMPDMRGWMRNAADVLMQPVKMPAGNVRLLHALDFVVKDLAQLSIKNDPNGVLPIPILD
jgi:CRISPR-associated protein Cas1